MRSEITGDITRITGLIDVMDGFRLRMELEWAEYHERGAAEYRAYAAKQGKGWEKMRDMYLKYATREATRAREHRAKVETLLQAIIDDEENLC